MKLAYMTVYPVKLYLLIAPHYTSPVQKIQKKWLKNPPNELVNEMIHYNSYGADQLLKLIEPIMKTLEIDLKSLVSKKLTEKNIK